MRRLAVCLVGLLAALAQGAQAAENSGYVGRDVCGGCHKDIFATHIKTNMARTWQGTAPNVQIPANYSETHAEGPAPDIQYWLKRTNGKLEYTVQMPGQPALEYPVETMVGGSRHGLSFLVRIPSLDGLTLPRARLIEARYFHSQGQTRLALSLGFPEEKPTTYETAFGRVLTPYLEKRCLGCHVAPRMHGGREETGVSCENCHGPGQSHLVALGKKTADHGIFNPKRLPVAQQFAPCSQCHAGSSLLEDPMPDDLLISDQVTALKNSECWKQSAGQITCVNCHNPHQDAPRAVLVSRAEKTCVRCHSATVTNRAGLCPVNRVSGCVGCHMPNDVRGAFEIAQHWIRVHPEQKVKVPAKNPAWRTTITPKDEFLRVMVFDTAGAASVVHEQLVAGGSFFDLARANSTDRESAINGGYLGDVTAKQLDPAWAATALKLEPGEISGIVPANGRYVLLQRMPRNFREDAQKVFNEAMELRRQGKAQEAAGLLLESLKIYPRFLRALTYLGVTYSEAGNPQTGAAILGMATRLYPQDAGAHFNLGIAYGAMGNADDEIAEYKKSIDIDADSVPAYLNWGGALFGKGEYEEAIKVYREGLDVNPVAAALHYSLSLALDKTDKKQEAASELALAAKIDSKYAQH